MFFTDSHEWIEVQGDLGKVGITSHAQKELGDIVYLELPSIGRKIHAGEEAIILESTKAAVDISSPVSGQIIAINDSLKTNIVPLNKDPENSGWLFKVKLPIS